MDSSYSQLTLDEQYQIKVLSELDYGSANSFRDQYFITHSFARHQAG